ncbi:hypothetical protein FRUB_03688 [Fimbriiglobus ruber]|uniref:Uncharacterized protein n=1 Tax=Fimbriiglobus ruber TaxID=1908690 RepID=A0A225DJH4_9BACT|nr:hypothetical protein FRUB_03688 [Fimbriiglobus ruber]
MVKFSGAWFSATAAARWNQNGRGRHEVIVSTAGKTEVHGTYWQSIRCPRPGISVKRIRATEVDFEYLPGRYPFPPTSITTTTPEVGKVGISRRADRSGGQPPPAGTHYRGAFVGHR